MLINRDLKYKSKKLKKMKYVVTCKNNLKNKQTNEP